MTTKDQSESRDRAGGRVAAVAIGRNEGARLIACLDSLKGRASPIVYVDSGSTDGSVAAARAAGAIVVQLDMAMPFTAARARNAGVEALGEARPDYVQFVDGDCIVQPDWIEKARHFLDERPEVAAVCGRRRERFPERSVYNRLCDREWDTPSGRTKACGGDALMRLPAFLAVGGFRESLIAGEEPELCVRLRQAGHEIWRIPEEMTLHDAAITRFSSWWKRNRRAGHAFAEGAALHGAPPERHWVAECRRIVVWGLAVPVIALAAGLVHPAGFAVLAIYPAKVARIALREGPRRRSAWEYGVYTTIGKWAELQGFLDYHIRRVVGRRSGLIEYK